MEKIYLVQYKFEKRNSEYDLVETDSGVLGLCRTYEEGLEYLRKFFKSEDEGCKKWLSQSETNFCGKEAKATSFFKDEKGDRYEEVLTLSEKEIKLGNNPADDICNLRFG